MRSSIDHLVVTCANLAQGDEWLTGQLGVTLQPGGRHTTMGTHNRLLRLGPRCYLELIAIDPEAATPTRPRWFALDDPTVRARVATAPFLHTWVAATDDLVDAVRRVPLLGGIQSFTRNQFSWRFALTDDGAMAFDGLLPALIQWEANADGERLHPAAVLEDRGCELLALELAHPQAAALLPLYRALRISGPVNLASGPLALGARIRTPSGEVLLR